jgi:hypothetical protein
MAKVALYSVRFSCPTCKTTGRANAREFSGDAGAMFSLERLTDGFRTSGSGGTRSDLRLTCACGHAFTPDLIENPNKPV